jgi:hypothetical protein
MADTGYFQVSGKLPNGLIAVINAEDWAAFNVKLIDALGPEAADQVVEQFAKALVGDPASAARTTHVPASAVPLTPVEVAANLGASIVSEDTVVCKHGEPAKFVAAGVSKKTGKPYRAFYACARRSDECDFRANG